MSENYFQHAYVTTDFDRAMADVARQNGIGDYLIMRDAVFDTGEGRTATCHFALAYKNGLQFEIVRPLAGDDAIYRDGLPDDGSYALRFHHVGRHFDRREDFEREKQLAGDQWSMPIAWDTMGGTYAYFDARETFGHYIEYFSFPPDSHLADVPRY